MTAIAGFTDGKKVWIGGDSAGVAGYSMSTRTDCKVFKSGEMVMGFTTSFRMGQILQYHLTPPTPLEGQSDVTYMVKQFIPAVKAALVAHGFEKNDSGRQEGGTFLVGYRGALFAIYSDYQVGCVAQSYYACGCGEDLVLGALFALDLYEMTPEERLTIALEAAEEFSAGVKAPFSIVSTGEERKKRT